MSSQVDLSRYACPAAAIIPALGWLALVLLLGAKSNLTLWSVVAGVFPGVLVLRLIWVEALLRSPHSIIRLCVHHDQLLACRRNGTSVPVTVEDSSRLFAGGALLKLRQRDTIEVTGTQPDVSVRYPPTQVLILDLPLCANVDTDTFRRLRVWLRFHGDNR